MKRFVPFLAIFLTLLLVLAVSCKQESIPAPEETLEARLVWAPQTGSTIFPWKGDAAEIAKEEGRLYFYYMAGEGTEVPGVGQKIGDSTLVVFPNGKTMLIDACSEAYCQTLVANLKRLGVKKLDYVVFTHGHSDHYACFTCSGGLCANFEIGHVYYDGTVNSGNTKIKTKCDVYGIEYSVLKRGDHLSVGDVTIDILNPSPDVVGTTVSVEADQNNTSITLRFTYGNVKALFCGDLYKVGMQNVLDAVGESALKADIVRIPHHGHSETSILQDFADAVAPKIAVASCGVTVNTSVYSMWKASGARILDDYTMGYIFVSTDGSRIYSETSRTRETSFYDRFEGSVTPAPAYVPEPDAASYFTVSSIAELVDAVNAGKIRIRLSADLDISAYTVESPLSLNMTGKVLDLNGHTVAGCSGTIKSGSDNDVETSLILRGSSFTIKNGTFTLSNDYGGYAFRINSLLDTDPNLNTNVVLEALTLTNAGVNVNGCTITIKGCSFTQPSTCTTNRPNLLFSYANVRLESGSYMFEGKNGGNANSLYNRWLRMYNTNLTIGNDVRYKGTLWYSVSTSRLNLERTLL